MNPIKYSFIPVIITFLLVLSCEKEKTTNIEPGNSGKLSHVSDCKSLKSATDSIEIADSLSCIEYNYNDTSKFLLLKHINAGFNCCPDSIYCDIRIVGDSVIIREFELSAGCRCNCLYDLEYEIQGISKKKYQVLLIEPYLADQDKLEVEIDLSDSNKGSICVKRKGYPWGY
jgi:hypothetical protein